MSKITKLPLAITGLLILLALCAWGQDQWQIEKLLPETTVLHIKVIDGENFYRQLPTSQLWKFLLLEDWPIIVNNLAQPTAKALLPYQNVWNAIRNILPQVFAGQLSFSIVEIKEGTPPVVLISWLAAEQQQLDSVAQEIRSQLTQMPFTMPMFLATTDNAMLISSDKSYLETLLSATSVADSLWQSSSYTTVKSKVMEERAGVFGYLNNRQLTANLPSDTGIASIAAIGLGISIHQKKLQETLYCLTPQQRTGALQDFFCTTPATDMLHKHIPPKLLTMTHGRIDFRNLYATAVKLSSMLPQFSKYLQQAKQFIVKDLAVDIEYDLLATLGDEYLFTLNKSGGLIPDVALQVSLSDSERFQKLWEKLLSIMPAKYFQKCPWKQHTLYYFNFSSTMEPLPVAPTVVIEQNRLLLTLFPESAKTILQASNLPQQILEFATSRPYTTAHYCNFSELVLPLYRTVLPMLQSMPPRKKLAFDPVLLPAANVLSPYLGQWFLLAMHDPQGLQWQAVSPLGTLPLASALGALFFVAAPHISATPPPVPPSVKILPLTPKSGMEAEVVVLEERRHLKVQHPRLEGILRKIWLDQSSLQVRIYAPIPKNTIGYGQFRLLMAQDDLGRKLSPADPKRFERMNRFSVHELKKVSQGDGFVFTLGLQAPMRNATSLNLQGSFVIKVAQDPISIILPEYSKIKSSEYQETRIRDTEITFTRCTANSIQMQVKGDSFKIARLVVKEGNSEKKTTGSSIFPSPAGDSTTVSYWFQGKIADTATIAIEYFPELVTQQVNFQITNQKLP